MENRIKSRLDDRNCTSNSMISTEYLDCIMIVLVDDSVLSSIFGREFFTRIHYAC